MSFDDAQPALGQAVRALRRRAGLSQEELALRADLEPEAIVGIEAGEEDPLWGDMRRLAGALGVSLKEIAEVAVGFERDDADAT
jgi:transcriptional regulator with XRE-family HTH domain